MKVWNDIVKRKLINDTQPRRSVYLLFVCKCNTITLQWPCSKIGLDEINLQNIFTKQVRLAMDENKLH